MSILTKILIILLTIASLFLCGSLVTYVAIADDFKAQNKTLKRQLQAAKESEKKANQRLSENSAKFNHSEDQSKKRLASLNGKISELEGSIKNLKRENTRLIAEVTSMASVVETSSQTTDTQTRLFEDAQLALKELKTMQIKQGKQLNETSLYLQERLAIIADLETKNKRLIEEKDTLQKSLNQYLQTGGKVAADLDPITRPKTTARPVRRTTRDISLKALITNIDMKNSMASISVGKTDGVGEGMKFYITRGEEFISEILIIEVDANEAVGILERMQQQPRIGDNASTNLL